MKEVKRFCHFCGERLAEKNRVYIMMFDFTRTYIYMCPSCKITYQVTPYAKVEMLKEDPEDENEEQRFVYMPVQRESEDQIVEYKIEQMKRLKKIRKSP
jgi:hypothetical protein